MTTNKTTALIEALKAERNLYRAWIAEMAVMSTQPVYKNKALQLLDDGDALAAFEQPQQRDKDACLSKSADSESQVRVMSVVEVAKIMEEETWCCQCSKDIVCAAKALAKLGTIRVVEG